MDRLRTTILSIINSGLDPSEIDALDLRQIRIVNVFTLVTAVIGIPFVFQYWSINVPLMSAAVALTIVVCSLNLLWLRRSLRPIPAGYIACSCLTSLLILSNIVSGGFYDPNFGWLYVVPVVAGLALGMRALWLFGSVTVVATIAFFALPYMGIPIPDRVPAEFHARQSFANRISAVFALIVLTWVFLEQRKWSDNTLKKALGEANRANEAKDQFLATMSHELRTPLTGIIGAVDLLETDSTNDTARTELMGILRRATNCQVALLNDILDFSKIESGHLTLEEAPFDLAEQIESVTAIYAAVASEKGITLQRHFRGIDDLVVEGDATRVRQVLLNLVGNAIKFTDAGFVRVTATASITSQLARIRIEVEDTGIGIAESEYGRLFTQFSQVDSSITRRFGGTGLGLAICKRLVEAMGGQIGVQSTPAEGSTFWFELSLVTVDQPVDRTEDTEANSITRASVTARILVAEDHAINRQLLHRMLSKAGHDVHAVGDGESALDAYQQRAFDLIVLDIHMPDIAGTDVARLIRAQETDGEHVPIIAVTADAARHREALYLSSGIDRVIGKPIAWSLLEQAIADVVRQDVVRQKASPDELQ